MPQKNSEHNYTKLDAVRYIKYLGCWTFVNEVDAVKRRDPAEYAQLLRQLIEVNKTRRDSVGRWERAAAKEVLKKLDKQKAPPGKAGL